MCREWTHSQQRWQDCDELNMGLQSLCVCNVRWPISVSFCTHAPTHTVWGTGSEIFSPFQLFQIRMTLISIITTILYKIVISSLVGRSPPSRSKPLHGEWWIPLCILGLPTPEGKIMMGQSQGGLKYTWRELTTRIHI